MNTPAQHITLPAIRQKSQQEQHAIISMGFSNQESFELMQRAAKLLSRSTIVPAAYRELNEKTEHSSALSNCFVALNMAQRMNADPLMVMQNLYIIEGRPSWSSQWIIAAINGCGRFSPLRFDLKELDAIEAECTVTGWVDRQRTTSKQKVAVKNFECIAWAIEKETGARIESPKVSIEMAVKEGWYGKNGSKWQTMPEVMLRYRTASFFGKLYAPELLMGLQSVEEVQDIVDVGSIKSDTAPAPETPPRVMTDQRELSSADARPYYPEDRFNENLPKWRDAIESGRYTPEHIIAMVQSKGPLTPPQVTTLRACSASSYAPSAERVITNSDDPSPQAITTTHMDASP